MPAYYNENDAFCAAWLRNLMAAGHLPAGDVDERSIVDVAPDDLKGYTQCHFFAGIGGWPLALAMAGWGDEEVWTGSCPCQPFSSAGQRKGYADERHLWPAFHRLIAKRRPATVLGEQVASRLGREWLAGVRADLESVGYAVGAADLPAACVGEDITETEPFREWLSWTISSCPDPVLREELRDFAEWACGKIILGAPHIRQRLWWVADAMPAGWAARRTGAGIGSSASGSGAGWLAQSDGRIEGDRDPQRGGEHGQQPQAAKRCGDAGGLGDADFQSRERRAGSISRTETTGSCQGIKDGYLTDRPTDASQAGFWSCFDIIPCLDGKARRVGPGIQPLAHGVPGRVGKLRAAGNAIVPQVAAEFIRAFLA